MYNFLFWTGFIPACRTKNNFILYIYNSSKLFLFNTVKKIVSLNYAVFYSSSLVLHIDGTTKLNFSPLTIPTHKRLTIPNGPNHNQLTIPAHNRLFPAFPDKVVALQRGQGLNYVTDCFRI